MNKTYYFTINRIWLLPFYIGHILNLNNFSVILFLIVISVCMNMKFFSNMIKYIQYSLLGIVKTDMWQILKEILKGICDALFGFLC